MKPVSDDAAEPPVGSGCLLAIDLGGSKCLGTVADAAGTVRHQVVHPTGSSQAEAALRGTVDDLRAAAGRLHLTPRAAVIGIPALIAPGSGLAVAGPNVQWHGFDVHRVVREHLAEPFIVDNDVNLAALGEAWRGKGRGTAGFVTLSLGTGVGAAVVLGGAMWRGVHNAAGEVGYMVSPRAHPRRPSPELTRLEDRISGQAIVRRAAQLLAGAGAGTSALSPADLHAPAVFDAARAADPVASEVLREVAAETALAILTIATVVDPEVVILDGGVGRAMAPWLDVIHGHLQDMTPFPPRVDVSTLAPNATIVGAIHQGLQLFPPHGQDEGDRGVIHSASHH